MELVGVCSSSVKLWLIKDGGKRPCLAILAITINFLPPPQQLLSHSPFVCCKLSFISASFFPCLPRGFSLFPFLPSPLPLTHLSSLLTLFATINFWLQCNHLPSSPRDPGSRSLWNAACKDPSSPLLWLWIHVWRAHACCQLPLPNWNWDASGLRFCLHCTPGGDTLPTSPDTTPSRGLLFMPSRWEKLSFPPMCGQTVVYMAKKRDGTERITADCRKATPVVHYS